MEKLNILYSCDDNYAPYTGISMTSLFENNQDAAEITVYLASMDISPENIRKMKQLAQQYGRNLVLLNTKAAQEKISQYHCKGWNGSLATWLRFFVFDQIPEDVDKLLWLDSDTIVQGSLQPLFATDLGDAPVGCVCDSICYRSRYRLGLSAGEPYYNAGVILFNLPVWKKENILPSMMQHLAANVSIYEANDQDLLNDYFRGRIYKLSPLYNLQGIHLAYTPRQYFSVYHWKEDSYYSVQQISQAAASAVVVHFFRFLGDYPWEEGNNYHPARELFIQWRDRSLWKDHRGKPCRKDTVFRIEKILYRMLPKVVFLKIFYYITNRNHPKAPVKRPEPTVKGEV